MNNVLADALERLCAADDRNFAYNLADCVQTNLQEILAALRAPSATEAAVPEGFVLVPKEPTLGMAHAGMNALAKHAPSPRCVSSALAEKVYEAMLAAASPAKQPKGE